MFTYLTNLSNFYNPTFAALSTSPVDHRHHLAEKTPGHDRCDQYLNRADRENQRQPPLIFTVCTKT